jgi:hypothetical protein
VTVLPNHRAMTLCALRLIAKVTSTHVTCTYEDGSYCVPRTDGVLIMELYIAFGILIGIAVSAGVAVLFMKKEY